MKILVTGVAGAIGSHVAEHFAKLGHEVVGVDILTDYYDRAIKEINLADVSASGVEVHLADLVVDDIDHFMDGVDVVFHFAAQPGISATTPLETYVLNNIIATHRLLEAASKVSGLKGFVHISTSSIYGAHAYGDETVEVKPTSYYGVTKLAAEQLALSYYRERGLPVVALRLFSVYGPRERPEKLYHKLIKSILEDKDFPLHDGSEHHVRSYTNVDDIVQACDLVVKSLDAAIGEIFNIGTDKTVTTGDGIKIIEQILGKPARIVVTPKRPGDQKETGANIGKARRILGYDPKVGVRDGLEQQVVWYKDKLHNKLHKN
ncbi:MAG: Nucleoside-diphosphate-sugar epimerase [Parcubacteria group bacterium GW2011_GWC1_42_11]|uniref:Nucleoside-diphosphate-sugar epimerase n=1 Tax=Candidatus Nomurabacteria bacterium GW2011_GWC2_42_20 TaxID=1618756 RepID=A0A0G0ZGM5_9BACT|nr:MAG: Nucleoside-diphosphate-sugar epimerase [Parcubacteria group bacterium GW2011_GWC1_42_11]KKS47915.1 MAG: Nucleoside-diphosphate-sugar epimerase [Candidatus Nomurabacteria bacterium GW2011_GWC2_42_20]KKS59101.1 MAG: Nucleoside-diphosphate-sugar epimerase [Candidatus Nomurabacteria bacterium GW2011_GWA2_42_41]KKT09682.1 MAG: Nucleoside-diphosphate-sugar epimerase [Candidatus Nomurabacteria bacterium GW2011_GWB1_43_20]TAN36620.1 MAG: NAD-dependent epimerase/dehydratase family protein [Pates